MKETVFVSFADGSQRVETLHRDLKHGGLCASKGRLHRAILTGVDYPMSDFTWADLRGAFLSDSCFKSARFEESQLITAFLDGCDLSYCCFSGATMRFADLSRSILVGADFSRADCFRVNFTEADLRGANMRAEHVETASFVGCLYDETTVWPHGFLPLA